MNKLFQETQQNSIMNKIQQMIPQQYQNNPKGAVDYLVQSGKVSQDALNKAMQIAQKMGVKF